MEIIEKKKYIAGLITKEYILQHRTILLISDAAKIFKAIFVGNIISINTAEDVRDFLDNYSKESEDIIIFEDLSLMTLQVQMYLLKFLEKNYSPLIVLASIDNISNILLSRFNKVIKIADTYKVDHITLDAFLAEHIEDLKNNYIVPELKLESAQYCPEYFYRYKKLDLSKHENKNKNQLIKYI